MLENTEYNVSPDSKAILVSIVSERMPEHTTQEESENSLNELAELARTLGIKTKDRIIQNKPQIDPATVLGSGKLQEIAELAREKDCDLLVFDFELSGGQVKKIEKITKLTVIDRVYLILEIFAHHARTKEAKMQIEIARLNYLLPRLSKLWSHLDRQKGGVGVRSGEGEQQIELDRRIIRKKIEFYKAQLDQLAKARKQQSKKRLKKAVTAALVGYTNAGKSSLMNRLCQVEILEEDKLFATLDSTYRTLNPDTQPPMILIDTVGFISNLPNTLIEGFKTTLESALEADLLIHVVDISHPQFEKHIDVTQNVLDELGLADKKKLMVFNKKDLFTNVFQQKMILKRFPGSYLVSSNDEEDVNNLRKEIIDYFLEQQEALDIFVPYEFGDIHAKVRSKTNIINSINHETGIFYRIKAPDFLLGPLRLEQFALKDQENPFNKPLST